MYSFCLIPFREALFPAGGIDIRGEQQFTGKPSQSSHRGKCSNTAASHHLAAAEVQYLAAAAIDLATAKSHHSSRCRKILATAKNHHLAAAASTLDKAASLPPTSSRPLQQGKVLFILSDSHNSRSDS